MAAYIASTDLKIGEVFLHEGQVYKVLKYEHIKKGRGQATIRLKVRNIQTNSITEKTFSNEEKAEVADVVKRTVQYLYSDENYGYFMDSLDFSQLNLNKELVEWELNFLKEGDSVVATFLDEKVVSIEIPKSAELKITETSAANAGNTANNATKEAILETGYKIQVPLFINVDEIIRINTEAGNYVGRVN